MSAPGLAVELVNVAAGYRGRPVFAGLSLSIAVGERVAFLGPNGAGKSTLLRVITGLLPATGTVRLFGRDLRQLPAAERTRLVSVVPQELDVAMPFTVGEMVAMGRTATLGRWHAPGADDRRIVDQAMAYTDTLALRERIFQEMSGGERQRVAIALALAAEPRLILLDEPTSHLDMNHRLEVAQLITRLNRERNVAVAMVGHDLNLAAEFFPRLVLLDGGRVAADGTPDEVLRPDVLRAVYHCDVSVQRDAETGALRVFPKPARS
jgi:iron complex transport system ATP-binding protein